MRALIIYYSRNGENYFGGSIKNIKKGNTEVVAEKLHELTGADLFKIEQVNPYSDNYKTCTEEAKKDKQNDARPELVSYPDVYEYDEIYFLYPNYWGTMPMAVFTLLDKVDLSEKTIYPLCTNEGSGMGSSLRDLKKLCPGSEIKDGLPIYGSEVYECDADLKRWLGK